VHPALRVTAAALIALLGVAPRVSAQAQAPDLGGAEAFALLGTTTIANTGLTTVSGNIGVNDGGTISGFPPGIVAGDTDEGGTIASEARDDAGAAFTELSGLAPDIDLTGQDLGGLMLTPGVYNFDTTAQLTGTLTLNAQGNPNAVFVFKLGTALTTAANATVLLTNGARALNVFWQVGSAATLGADVNFAGTLIANTGVVIGARTVWTGRAMSISAGITLDTSNVILPLQDLVTIKTTASPPVVPGQTFVYDIVVTNSGIGTAYDVSVTDELPAQLAFVSSTTGCTAVLQVVTCGPSVDIAPSGTLVDDITVRLSPSYVGNGSDIGNIATATSSSYEPTPADNASQPASPPTLLAPSADLSIVKAAVEAAVSPGELFTYLLTVTNNGPSTALNVVVADTLPASLTFVSSVENCAPVSGAIVCPTVASLLPSGTATFHLVVRLSPAYTGTGADIQNQASVSSATSDSDLFNNTSNAATPPPVGAPESDLQLAKSVSSATVTPGSTFTYTLVVTNNGPAVATGIVVTDALPTQVAFVSSVAGCSAAGLNVTCPTLATLNVGDNASYDIVVRLSPAYTGNGSDISNTGSVTSTTQDSAPANNTAGAGSPPVAAPATDVSIVKNVDPTPVSPGGTVAYSLVITNAGPSTATGILATDTLPTGLTFAASVAGCTASAQVVTCPVIATLAPGSPQTLAFTAQLSPGYTGNGTDLPNSASITVTTTDPDLTNNTSATVYPTIGAASADLSVTKVALETSTSPGQTFTYSITVSNAGPSNAAAVVVTDTLPAQLAYVGSPSGCTATGQVVTCGPVTLAASGTAIIDVVVRLDPAYTGTGGDIQNVASVSSSTSDPTPGNNSSLGAAPPPVGSPESDLQLVKSVSSTPVTPGTPFTYTVQVTNNGPAVATAVVITDPLPAQTTFVSSVAGCTVVGQNVTCPTVATLAVGATASVDIVVLLNPGYTGNGTDVLNSASVTAATLDPSLSNNSNPPGAPPSIGPPGADVTVVKTVSAAPVTAGGTFTYTLLVSNQGPSVAADVVTSDVLPAGVTFLSSVDGCAAVGQTVTCPTIASFAASASRSFGLTVELDANYAGNGADLPNRGTVTTSTMDPVPGNNTSAPVTPHIGPASADLSAAKVALGDSVSPGMLFTYRISVMNAGPSTARDISVSDTLPASLAFVSSVAGCTAVGQSVTCLRPAMASGTTADFDVTVRLDAAYAGDGTDLANTATVTASTPDPEPGNNTTAPAPPPPFGFGEADLTLTKSGPSGTVPPNSEVTYTIVVSNQGPNAATSVVVQDPTPAGLTLIATSGDCVTAFPCQLGTLLAGRARTITARYATGPTAMAMITNTASVSSPTPDPTLGSNTATAATPAEPRTYYLAEGATGTFWTEEIAIANPNAAAAPVTMTYFTEAGTEVTAALTVPARSHVSVHVNAVPGLTSTSASAQITSDTGLPLAVERTMTWDATMYGGHTETAAAELSTHWYFAEGALGYFETFLLLGNTQTTPTTATITFLLEGAPPVARTVTIGAHARLTLPAGAIPELAGRAFGIAVVASQPIVAERSMYFGTTATRLWSGGHSSGGVSAPSRRWFYAEGATGSFFDTFILLSNPQLTAAHVTMEYLLPNGTVITAAKIVPARGRLTVSIDNEADVRLRAATVSTRITSDVPIVTERSMYWDSKPDVFPWSEGHNSFGVDQAAERWVLAGGRIGGPNHFQTYVLLSNPWTAAANVTVTFLRDGQPPIVRTLTVAPTTRHTLDVSAVAPELAGEEFGVAIAVTNGLTINVERSNYWDANGVFWTAGTNAAGTRLP